MMRVHVAYSLITNADKTKVLMVRNHDTEGWTLPGGTIEGDETLEGGAIREAKEETGLDVKVHGIVAVNEYIHDKSSEHIIFITFRGEIVGGTEKIMRPDEITDIQWVELEQADKLMPYYKEGLSQIVKRDVEVTYFDEGRF